ncbi:MAG: WD40 repeat domain-containing protein [bacterium]|nr:WD40 repeat domain-containing protein [bacterium]
MSAREPEAIYLARRFIARHRVGVATSLGLVLGTLAIIAALAWSLDEVDQARRTAEERTRIAVRNEYAAHLAAARAALATGDALSARRHLDAAVPRLRGWEWRYLASQCDTSESTIPGAIGRTLKDIAWLDHERLALIYENGEIVETNTERDWLKISRGRFGFDFQRYCIDRARERMFAIVDHYRTVIAIDLRTWQRTVLFRTDPNQPRDLADIRAIALGHGQRTLAISQNSGIVTLLATSGTTPPRRLCRADSYAWVMTFSRDDESLLLGTGSGFVKGYRVSDGVLTSNVFVDDEGVKTLVLAEDERTVFASGGSHLRRFDRASGALLQRVDAGCELEELRLSADGQRLYGIGSPGAGQVKSWSTTTLELTGRFHGHPRTVRRLDLAPETDRIVAISRSAVRVWPPDPPPPVRQLEAGFNINDLAVAPDGEAFGTSTSTGIARIWNARTCKLELQIDCRDSVFAPAGGAVRRDSVFGCALGQDTMWLGGSKLVAIDRATKTTRLGESPPHGISRMAIDPNERWLAAGSVPWGRLFVWQLPAMKLVHDLELPISDRVAFDEARNEFVVAGLGDALYRLNPGSGRVQREQHPGVGKHSLTIRGDLVTTGDDALFVGRSGSPLVPMPATETITAIAIAHDHQRIATCDANAQVTLWDREGTELLVLDDAPKLVTKLAFAANDTRLVGISQLPGAQCFVMVWGAQLPPAPRRR